MLLQFLYRTYPIQVRTAAREWSGALPNFDSVSAGIDRIIQPDHPHSIAVINNLGVKSDFQNVGLGGTRIGAAMSATGPIAELENAVEVDMAQRITRLDSVNEFAALGPVPHGISAGAG